MTKDHLTGHTGQCLSDIVSCSFCLTLVVRSGLSVFLFHWSLTLKSDDGDGIFITQIMSNKVCVIFVSCRSC